MCSKGNYNVSVFQRRKVKPSSANGQEAANKDADEQDFFSFGLDKMFQI